ncbi:MAG: carbonic anhydrase [Flavobacteriales bacterium]|nr:carbonic anhydrase [Flavobacteriales bacterium]
MSRVNIVTPERALELLKAGNVNFQENLRTNRDLLDEVKEGCGGQAPFATVLSCIDSRMPTEMIFDQGIGDIFSIRIAGNFSNEDIIGSMEFAAAASTTRLIVVMGHTACGAVKGACDARVGADFGDLDALAKMLKKLYPAVDAVIEPTDKEERTSENSKFVNEVAEKNVGLTIDNIRAGSPAIEKRMSATDDSRIMIVGAMYDICTGEVTFDR